MANYNDFRTKVYASLIRYKKEELKIEEKGISSHGVPHDCLFPEPYSSSEIPVMLYKGIVDIVKDIQKCAFAYKPHIAASNHVASSQTACINLFVPILECDYADEIIKKSGVCPSNFDHIDRGVRNGLQDKRGICPSNFDHIDRTQLRKGYCFEYWEQNSKGSKGLLGDHTPRAGTDSDVAISYIDKDGNRCLWLIEHKLTEREFTTCGAYNSDRNPVEMKENCKKCSLSDFYADHNKCHYHKNCGYYYWNIMEQEKIKQFYSGQFEKEGCPFRGGMNQLWRNQMMAFELERIGLFKEVFFSVVSHPENTFLDKTMEEYRKLINNSNKFSDFKSKSLVDAAIEYLPDWVDWYKRVYMIG